MLRRLARYSSENGEEATLLRSPTDARKTSSVRVIISQIRMRSINGRSVAFPALGAAADGIAVSATGQLRSAVPDGPMMRYGNVARRYSPHHESNQTNKNASCDTHTDYKGRVAGDSAVNIVGKQDGCRRRRSFKRGALDRGEVKSCTEERTKRQTR